MASVRKLDRRTINLEFSKSHWLFFVTEWQMYKRQAILHSSHEIAEELRMCCTVEL